MGKKTRSLDGRTDGRSDGRSDGRTDGSKDGSKDGKAAEELSKELPKGEHLLLQTLEQLLAIGATDLHSALNHASTLISDASNVDKIDAFLIDPTVDTLVAVGASDTPMARQQKRLGLDRLPLANKGRIVETFVTGKNYCTGRADLDPEVAIGYKEALGIRSMAVVRFNVNGEGRGVLHVASATPDLFDEADMLFFEAAAHWLGVVAHRAELTERVTQDAAEQARHIVAEELVTTLAHDLRNYITPIKGHIEIVRQRATRESRTADIRNVDAALDGVKRLSALISDLLDVARLEQGIFQTAYEPIDLAALVEEAASVFRGADSTLNLRLPDELVVEADPGRVRQALDNLIANAIEHSPKGLPVTVALEAETREDGKWAVITVRDEGPGIDSQLLPKLFMKFGNGHSSTGLGLGLYLARGIAEAHGGTLAADTEHGKGTSFKLSVPVERAAVNHTLRAIKFSRN